jgi:hypothetical protein
MRHAARTLIAVAAIGLLGTGVVRSQVIHDVFCIEPADRARVGPKPRFRMGIRGAELEKVHYRIELSRDDFETIEHTFDQLVNRSGWGVIDPRFENPGAVYLTSKPLEDGTYDWRPWAHNGIDWVEGKIACRIEIDSIAPETVEVQMYVSPEGNIVLDWDLVTLDLDGRPEYVTKYHVYRYKMRTMFFVVRPFHYAEVDQPPFEDDNPDSLATRLLFYKVTAEDEAGNETERRY